MLVLALTLFSPLKSGRLYSKSMPVISAYKFKAFNGHVIKLELLMDGPTRHHPDTGQFLKT